MGINQSSSSVVHSGVSTNVETKAQRSDPDPDPDPIPKTNALTHLAANLARPSSTVVLNSPKRPMTNDCRALDARP